MATIKDAALWFERRASKTPMAGARAMFRLAADALHEKAEREAMRMTNADRIRAMTDEELYEFIGIPLCAQIDRHSCLHDDRPCKDCIMEWLRQPAKEG